jgi:aminopeptidase N
LRDYQAGRSLMLDQRVITAFDATLESCIDKIRAGTEQDKAMVAQLLALPSEAYLSELADEVDVAGIHIVREHVADVLAKTLASKFATLYDLNVSAEPYRADGTGIARRALKNSCLAYLMRTQNTHWLQVCKEQFDGADNMTDVNAALRLLVNCAMPEAEAVRESVLASFYSKWQDEALVVDQWFSIQASSVLPGALERVQALMLHPAFSIKNPNKVRALIGAFCGQNALHFHEISGAGYEFLADRIIQLNALNPQIASRLVTPLTRWKKYDSKRQALMRAQLQRISKVKTLSKDVYEVVAKSLK